MDWIESKTAKWFAWSATILSFSASVFSIINWNWVMDNLTILVPIFSFFFFSILLSLHYYQKRKKYIDSKFTNLENSNFEYNKDEKIQANKIEKNKENIERIDRNVGTHWQHIKNIGVALDDILEKEGKERLNI